MRCRIGSRRRGTRFRDCQCEARSDEAIQVRTKRAALPSPSFALSLSKGQYAVAGALVRLLTVGRGSPAASYFSCLAKKSNQKKATPLIPETPEIEPAGRAAKNSPRFICISKVSGAQTPLPLIHPTGSIFGGAERGGKSKPRRRGPGGLSTCVGMRVRSSLFNYPLWASYASLPI
jgi:hypothetical protein